MANGPGKRPRVIYNVQKSELNINKNDIVLLDDGLYVCSQVNRGAGCCQVAKVTLVSWDPDKNTNGKILVKRT